MLTQDDIYSGRIFEDQVAYGGWWLDLHPPSGVDAVDEKPCVQHHIPYLYSIPLRCLYSRNVANLFFAGRNISATHVAFASTRVMATCAVVGQAVGTAAAAMRDQPPDIAKAATPSTLGKIQQELLKNDAFLPSLVAMDKTDLAQSAMIRASSEAEDAPACLVRNGLTRRIESDWGRWAEAAGNCWQSATLPAWIDLEWPEPALLSEVHLTFCTGLARELTLSPSDSLTAKTIRGAQPETVRDYNLVLDGKTVLEIRDNYLRKQKHVFSTPICGRKLRIDVLASNGLPAARIFEIRLYQASS